MDIESTNTALRSLSVDRIKISTNGIDVVENHLNRFKNGNGQPWGNNTVMVDRLRKIASGEMAPTVTDLNFYSHELREFVRFRNAGFENGLPPKPFYRSSHYATLDEYGIPFDNHGDFLYTPFALSMLYK